MMLSGNLARLLCLVMAPRVNTRQAKWAFFFCFPPPSFAASGKFQPPRKKREQLTRPARSWRLVAALFSIPRAALDVLKAVKAPARKANTP